MRLLTVTAFGAWLLLGSTPLSAQPADRIAAEGGDIVITPILHSSVQIEHAGTVVHIDPWSAGDLAGAKPADLILVTDDPGHHLDPEAIAHLRKPGAPVVLTAAAHARFGDGEVLANGEQGVFAGVPVEAVPAYDMTPGQPWHPPGEANGYVITLGGRRLFFSGVGECVPEIQALEDITVAFMPMNLPLDRMRPRPVAECVKTFGPEGRLPHPLRQRHGALVRRSRPAPAGQRRGDRRHDRGAAGGARGGAHRGPRRRLVSAVGRRATGRSGVSRVRVPARRPALSASPRARSAAGCAPGGAGRARRNRPR